MRRILLASLLLAAGLAAPAASQHGAGESTAAAARHVSIGFASLAPERVDIVTGETVLWTNDSARVHTVTADDDSFDSGRFAGSQTYRRRFEVAGEVPYHCRLHPSIKGIVAVHDLLLDAPSVAAAPDMPFPLGGRASASLAAGAEVSIQADTGAGFTAVGSATVGPDGAFAARLSAPAAGSYRAVAGGVTSPPVQLLVLDRQISLTATRLRGRLLLRSRVTPAAPGERVVLQLYLPERFGWWPVQSAQLDRGSAARFALRTKRRLRARVRLTLSDGVTALATSRTLQTRGASHETPPASVRRRTHGSSLAWHRRAP